MILVTGGAGFIGSHLCGRLALEGYDVVSLDDYSTGSEDNHHPGVSYRRGSTVDVARLIPERPDVIFHLGEYSRVEASFANAERCRNSNEYGTAAIRLYWLSTGAKLVYSASSTIFASDNSDSPYAQSKRENVRLFRLYRDNSPVQSSITYFYNVYGPGERPASEQGTVVETFRRQFLAGLPMTVVAPGTQRRNFTHVHDIVDGLMLAMKHNGEFAIGASQSYSVLDVADMFGGQIHMLPEREGNRMGGTIDTSAIQELGWKQNHLLEEYVRQCRISHNIDPFERAIGVPLASFLAMTAS